MPTARQETITAEVATRLGTVATALSGTFERNRLDPIEGTADNAVILYDGSWRKEPRDTGGEFRVMRLAAVLYVTAANGEALGQALNAGVAAIEAAIVTDDDRDLGGLVDEIDVVEISDPEFGEASDAKLFAAAELAIEIGFSTAWFDPYTAA